jgi:hypothetical protein
MKPNYDLEMLNKYNIKFDQNKHVCDSIYNNLSQIFKWNQQDHYKLRTRLCNLKNMENFDMKNCVQYANIPKEITSITQVHKKSHCKSPYSADYFLKIDKGNIELIYEFD